jgi:hypothetical protein
MLARRILKTIAASKRLDLGLILEKKSKLLMLNLESSQEERVYSKKRN